jgi:hypothetical protein
MAKSCIREFKLADSDGLHPCLNAGGAFVGDGTALLTKDNFGDFVPLPRRELETVLSAGYKFAVDLGSRMQGLTALAKALNQGDYSLASIALAQLQFPALPDKSAGARMSKAAAMLKKGATALEVLKLFLPKGELAKFNPHHLGPGAGGGEFTTAEMNETSSGDHKARNEPSAGASPPPGAGATTQPKDTYLPRSIQRKDGSTISLTFDGRTKDGLSGDQMVTIKLSDSLTDILSETKDIQSVNISATTNAHTHGDHVSGDAVDVNRINGVHVDSSGDGLAYAYELESAAMKNPNVRYVEGPFGNFVRSDADTSFSRSKPINGDQTHVHISVFPEK